MIKLGLAPMLSGLDIAYYRAKAETDPVLALAGLRIDLETMMRNVAVGSKYNPLLQGRFPVFWHASERPARLRQIRCS